MDITAALPVDIRDHALSRIKEALKDNKHIKETQVAQAAADTEQRCFERADEASNARQAAHFSLQRPSDAQPKQATNFTMPDM